MPKFPNRAKRWIDLRRALPELPPLSNFSIEKIIRAAAKHGCRSCHLDYVEMNAPKVWIFSMQRNGKGAVGWSSKARPLVEYVVLHSLGVAGYETIPERLLYSRRTIEATLRKPTAASAGLFDGQKPPITRLKL